MSCSGNKIALMIIGALPIKRYPVSFAQRFIKDRCYMCRCRSPLSTDIDLLHDGCKVINRYTGKLCRRLSLVPPLTYYKEARSAYLGVVKFNKLINRVIRIGRSLLLTYLYVQRKPQVNERIRDIVVLLKSKIVLLNVLNLVSYVGFPSATISIISSSLIITDCDE